MIQMYQHARPAGKAGKISEVAKGKNFPLPNTDIPSAQKVFRAEYFCNQESFTRVKLYDIKKGRVMEKGVKRPFPKKGFTNLSRAQNEPGQKVLLLQNGKVARLCWDLQKIVLHRYSPDQEEFELCSPGNTFFVTPGGRFGPCGNFSTRSNL